MCAVGPCWAWEQVVVLPHRSITGESCAMILLRVKLKYRHSRWIGISRDYLSEKRMPASDRICAGVVPQQPPTRLAPARIHSTIPLVNASGTISNTVRLSNSRVFPALGCARSGRSIDSFMRLITSAVSSWSRSPQLAPTAATPASSQRWRRWHPLPEGTRPAPWICYVLKGSFAQTRYSLTSHASTRPASLSLTSELVQYRTFSDFDKTDCHGF